MRITLTFLAMVMLAGCAGRGQRKDGPVATEYVVGATSSGESATAPAHVPLFTGPFEPECDLPYAFPGPERAVDRDCPIAGNAHDGAGVAEYRAKSNLCATGTPVRLTLKDFSRLQAAVVARDIPHESSGAKILDRSVLESLASKGGVRIGEGSLVQVAGYVQEVPTTYDGTSGGEGVNCKLTDQASNDFHANITRVREQEPCEGIVVEMIPHFRPVAWTSNVVRTLKFGPKVRVTGALFFDAKHRVEACPMGGQARRFSLRV